MAIHHLSNCLAQTAAYLSILQQFLPWVLLLWIFNFSFNFLSVSSKKFACCCFSRRQPARRVRARVSIHVSLMSVDDIFFWQVDEEDQEMEVPAPAAYREGACPDCYQPFNSPGGESCICETWMLTRICRSYRHLQSQRAGSGASTAAADLHKLRAALPQSDKLSNFKA